MSSLSNNGNISKVCIITDESSYTTSNQVQKVSIESMTATNIHDCNISGNCNVLSNSSFSLTDSVSGNKVNLLVPDLTSAGTDVNITFPNTTTTLGSTSSSVYWIGYKNSQQGNDNGGVGGWRYMHSFTEDISAGGSWKVPTSNSDLYFSVPETGVYMLTSDVTRSVSAGSNFMVGWLKKNGSLPATTDGIYGGIDLSSATDPIHRLHTTAVMYLTTTDYVCLAVFDSDGGVIPQTTDDFNRLDTAIVKIA